MQNNQPIKSEIKTTTKLTLVLGGFISILISYYIFSNSNQSPYIQIFEMTLSGLFLILGLIGILSIYLVKHININDGTIVITSVFSKFEKKISIEDIIHWEEIINKNKTTPFQELIVYTKNSKLKIDSITYKNYNQLRSSMTTGKPRMPIHTNQPVSKIQLQIAQGLILVSLLIFFISYRIYIAKDNEIKNEDLYSLTDSIANVVKVANSKGNRSINIILKSHPSFVFNISGVAYSSTLVKNFIENVSKGDTIIIDISKEEYMMKISKEKELDFWTKRVNYPFISIYNLKAKGKNYLYLSDYNAKCKTDRIFTIYVCFYSVLLLIAIAIYHYYKYKLSILKKN